MPFDAAKAIAATFCYSIRYALIPLFGPSFASMCLKPGTEDFGQMVIDPDIISRCTREAKRYRDLALSERFDPSRSTTPETKPLTASLLSRQGKSKARPVNGDTAYISDPDGSDSYLPSPQSIVHCTPPRSSKPWPGTLKLPFAQNVQEVALACRREPTSPSSSSSGGSVSPKTNGRMSKARKVAGIGERSYPSPTFIERRTSHGDKSPSPVSSTKETRAACALMQLHLANTSLMDVDPSPKKRRASS